MKSLKKGFSLAELLIALAIMSIIASMGITISKRGIERAYNMYFYTGYANLEDAINAAEKKEKSFISSETDCSDGAKYIAKLFNGKCSIDNSDRPQLITTPSGIAYKFYFDSTSQIYYIAMIVPGIKKAAENVAYFIRYKDLKAYNSILIPYQDTSQDGSLSGINLQNRPDLIAFYTDDGITGKKQLVHVCDEDGENCTVVEETPDNSSKPKYTSFLEAFCGIYGDVPNYVTCGSTTKDSNKAEHILRHINPRKVF